MKIYKKCPCCNKTIFLLLGSDFNNEVELASGFGSKDNIPHGDTDHTEDYHCLNKFLHCLSNSHGQVFISLTNRDEDKIPEEFQELILNWTEKGYQKPQEKPKNTRNSGGNQGSNNSQQTFNDGKDWFNIHEDFHPQLETARKQARGETLKEQWIKARFTYNQCKEWIDIGLKSFEVEWATWLRNTKRLTPEQVLNYGNITQLREEWENTLPQYEI